MPGSMQIGCVDVNTFYWHVYQLAIFKSLQLEILTSGEVTELENASGNSSKVAHCWLWWDLRASIQ